MATLSLHSSRSSLRVPGPEDDTGAAPGLATGAGTVYPQWKSLDPRSSSTQSLTPSLMSDGEETRRTLLIIYVHGFMGNDSSFRSFPAHVHSYLKTALAETHVIHSKIYPRYKTYKAIEVARDNFSKWLEPHETETTDIILIGHSMGGLLAAEIVLIPAPDAQSGYPFKHRILGTISLDSPFLGLHPGIIVSGIASLFRKAPDPPKDVDPTDSSSLASPDPSSTPLSPDPSILSELALPSGVTSPTTASMSSSMLGPSTADPTFNPPFFNDVLFKDRGWWKNVAHFTQKHKPEGVVHAARHHIINHLEFGACLMDFVKLNQRYDKLRHLEDVDDFNMSGGHGGAPPPRKEARVRFVNYFTLSTGRKPKSGKSSGRQSMTESRRGSGVHLKPVAFSAPNSQRTSLDADSRMSTPRISIEDYSDSSRIERLEEIEPMPLPEPELEMGSGNATLGKPSEELADIPEVPNLESPDSPSASKVEDDKAKEVSEASTADLPAEGDADAPEADPLDDTISTRSMTLPPVPDLPTQPQPPDLDMYTDKEARRQAEREGKRVQKAYDQAVKNREKAIRERQKLLDSQRKKAQKEADKRAKAEEKKRKQEEAAQKKSQEAEQREAQRLAQEEQKKHQQEQDEFKRTADELERQLQRQATEMEAPAEAKKKKERKFCTLPRKVNGARDPTWVEVYMEGVDEVGAHCGLFFNGPQYEKLIGDVGERIVSWVQEDASKRAILALD